MKSVEDRLRDAKNDLALIIAGLSVDAEMPIEDQEVSDAMLQAAARAHDELYWLTRLPAAILNTDAPTTDEIDARKRKSGAR